MTTDATWRMQLSALYHLRRVRHFELIDKVCSMLTAVAATAAVTALLKQADTLNLIAAAATAALSLVPLVCSPAEKARVHGRLAVAYRHLRALAERAAGRDAVVHPLSWPQRMFMQWLDFSDLKVQ
jgi:hypothetical protein